MEEYKCPDCGNEFKETFKERSWGSPSFKQLKGYCPNCGRNYIIKEEKK